VYVRKVYTIIINCNLTMITSCSEMVNLNCVAIGVDLMLSEQLLCNWHTTLWHTTLMHTIMSHVQLGQGP
jgi:hypothetical protein